jgi:predicted site-specific integrase-resolvase
MSPFAEMTTAEAMARLNVKQPSTISRWVRDGRLTPSRRLGDGPRSKFMFWRADVERLADEIAADLRDQLAALEHAAS